MASESQEFAQHRDEGRVGRRHRVVGEPQWSHPGEALSFPRRRGPRPFAADIERHQQMKVGLGVGCKGKWGEAARRDIDAELLGELAD